MIFKEMSSYTLLLQVLKATGWNLNQQRRGRMSEIQYSAENILKSHLRTEFLSYFHPYIVYNIQ